MVDYYASLSVLGRMPAADVYTDTDVLERAEFIQVIAPGELVALPLHPVMSDWEWTHGPGVGVSFTDCNGRRWWRDPGGRLRPPPTNRDEALLRVYGGSVR